jgi:hypothetical protein
MAWAQINKNLNKNNEFANWWERWVQRLQSCNAGNANEAKQRQEAEFRELPHAVQLFRRLYETELKTEL